MADTVNVNFRIDKDLKASMEKTCSEMGLSMTAAITMFVTKVVREHRIPFEVNSDPFYSEENQERLRKAIAQLEAGKGTIHEVVYE